VVKRTTDLKDKLGQDKLNEVLDKEWKTAELPSEEELSAEQPASPKARNNINSRKNLIQYQKDKPREVKEKIVSNLTVTEVEEDVNPLDILDEGVREHYKLLDSIFPTKDIFSSRQEQEIYWNNVNLFLRDFDITDLTSSDIDDIVALALNRVLEHRLLKACADNPKKAMDVAPSIEKFRRHSEKVKSSLANRRVDRVDTKNKQSFSVVDLAARHDDERKDELEKRIRLLEEEALNYPVQTRDGLRKDEQ
jgi:hypothetical protein